MLTIKVSVLKWPHVSCDDSAESPHLLILTVLNMKHTLQQMYLLVLR